MNSFLQAVAKDMLAKHPDGLVDIAVVFPNKRASLFLNKALYEETGRPLWSPAYVTISDLYREHSNLTVPDQMLLVFRLYNVYREITGSDETLDHFYSWGELLLADFDDIDKNMVDADQLFINLETWQGMKDFSFLTDTQRQSLEEFFGRVMDNTELQQRFNDIWKYLAPIYHRFREKLEAEGLAYEGMLYRKVMEQQDIVFHYKHYIFIGFNLLQKVEQQLFRRMKEEGRAEFYWDYDVYYAHAPLSHKHGNRDMEQRTQDLAQANEAGKYISRYLDLFPNELSPSRISPDLSYDDIYDNMSDRKDITYISAPTENIQARYISSWLREKGRIAAAERTAIVLGDESLLQTVVHCLPDEVKDVNITTGYPLSASPVTTWMDALLDLQLKGTAGGKGRFRLKYVMAVLLHPYAKYVSDDCQTLLKELDEHKQYYPTQSYLTSNRDEAMGELFTILNPEEKYFPLMAWLSAILKRVGIGSNGSKDPLMHESTFRMYTLVNRLEETMCLTMADPESQNVPSIDPKTNKQIVSISIFQRLLSQLVQSTSIPYRGEPVIGIQIMGMLETRNLDFDHILVLSCNEGNLPKGMNDVSFMPHSIRAGYELTTVENKVAIYAYYFHSLMQRASDITLTYNNTTDDGRKGEMSRFMLQFMVENAACQEIRQLTLQSGQNVTLINRKEITKDADVMEKLQQIPRISPSALSKYLRCPLQFYYSSICGLREADNDNDEIDNRIFGDIFHRSAELIYYDLSDGYHRTITAQAIDELLKDRIRLHRYVDKAFAESLFKVESDDFKPQYNGLQLLNRKVIILYVERLLRLDRQSTPFDILSLEGRFYDKMTFSVNGQHHTVEVGGLIDRLDQVMIDGRPTIRVVDYKTGTPLGTKPKDVSEIFDSRYVDSKHTVYYLQAFIYAGIIRHGKEAITQVNPQQLPVAPCLLFIRQASFEGYDPTLTLSPGKSQIEVIDDIELKYHDFQEGLQNLLAEIYNAETPFKPTEETVRCGTCPYQNICGLA